MSLTLLSDLPRRLERRRGCCALVAVKQRLLGKSRLAPELDPVARVALVRAMLEHVLATAAATRGIAQIIVLSPERDTIPEHIPVLADSGRDLNAALGHARSALLEFGVRECLVLPADLPRVSAEELGELVRAGRESGFAIAPDAAGSGTNALCLATGQPFRFRFGPDSRALHLKEAAQLGLEPQILQRPGLGFDIDSPEDLQRYRNPPCARHA